MPAAGARSKLRAVKARPTIAALLLGFPFLLGNAVKGPAPGADLRLVPEAERPYRRLVIGLDPLLTSPYMLPEGSRFEGGNERNAFVRRQLYWLNWELMHGRILGAIPHRTRVFVAVPDPALHAPGLGDEREEFRAYLKERAGWTAAEIAERVRFFIVDRPTPYPQDMAEPIGVDAAGRLVLGIGAEADLFYRETVQQLARTFPADFAVHLLPGVNTEGGDVELVRLPDGKLGLLAGHHRVLRWLEYQEGNGVIGRAVSAERIERARSAFRKAFFGLDVIVVNEEGLRSPSLVSDELFHSDMIVNVVRGRSGPTAFVPSYEAAAVDAVSHEPLAPEVRTRAQAVYERVARQLGARGFRVVRLPIADHPVRNPVNVGKYTEPDGTQVVLLGRYPYHFALPDGLNPQRELQKRFDALADVLLEWKEGPVESRWGRVTRRFTEAWAEMDRATTRPNPTFDRQAKAYEAEGIRVVPVPIYPTGEGGLHCLGLAEGTGRPPAPPGSRMADGARPPARQRLAAGPTLSRTFSR